MGIISPQRGAWPWLICAWWWSAWGCVGATAAQAADQPRTRDESSADPIVLATPQTGLHVGERLNFDGRWFGIPVGSAWIEVVALTTYAGRPAYAIEAQGRSNDALSTVYPIHDVIRSHLDAETLQPLSFEKIQREGSYRADEGVTFDYERLTAHYHSRLNGTTKDISIPSNVHDIISAFYWLRTHPLRPGQPVQLNVYSDEKIYELTLKPVKTLWLELLWRGEFPCLLIEPVAEFEGILVKRGRVWLYLNADAQRIPLLTKISTPWGPITGLINPDSLPPSANRQGSRPSETPRDG